MIILEHQIMLGKIGLNKIVVKSVETYPYPKQALRSSKAVGRLVNMVKAIYRITRIDYTLGDAR